MDRRNVPFDVAVVADRAPLLRFAEEEEVSEVCPGVVRILVCFTQSITLLRVVFRVDREDFFFRRLPTPVLRPWPPEFPAGAEAAERTLSSDVKPSVSVPLALEMLPVHEQESDSEPDQNALANSDACLLTLRLEEASAPVLALELAVTLVAEVLFSCLFPFSN